MQSDKELAEDKLQRGHTPIWIRPPKGTSKVEMIERVFTIPELKLYKNNVTVLYSGKKNEDIMEMCEKIGYKYIDRNNITGAEDQAVILLDIAVFPEFISRAINLLIIVRNR